MLPYHYMNSHKIETLWWRQSLGREIEPSLVKVTKLYSAYLTIVRIPYW